ncbi:MAG: hypothetical protein HEQ24_16405 [Dolichospermum sp. BR01]|nr:hypothetical protein [Dolichospermum sp. BR01]
MHLILLFISIAVLFLFPILYPPIASFTAYFFAKDDRLDAVSLFLLYSAAIVTSLIAATITPYSDTANYLRSFERISFFDFRMLSLDNDGFEPLYKVYELILSIFIGDNPRLFLLTTALIINTLATTAILRICIRLHQYQLPCLILAVCYSLVAPAFGMPLFLLRSSLSLAILFLGISFYNELPLLFYLLGIVSIFIHFSSLLVFGLIIVHKYCLIFGIKISELSKKIFYTSISGSHFSKVFLLIFIAGFFVALFAPSLTAPTLLTFLSNFGSSENVSSGKAKSFLDARDENTTDFTNPVFIIQVLVTLFCFLKIQNNSASSCNKDQLKNMKNIDFLGSLMLVGRTLITLIIVTAPINALPYRLGFFNFMYFPLWLINVPFTFLGKQIKNYSQYLVLFTLVSVLAYSFYWVPKREGGNYYAVVVLESKPLQYNLVQLVGYFL